jgi:sRNA-binding regulator protein Hfq
MRTESKPLIHLLQAYLVEVQHGGENKMVHVHAVPAGSHSSTRGGVLVDRRGDEAEESIGSLADGESLKHAVSYGVYPARLHVHAEAYLESSCLPL